MDERYFWIEIGEIGMIIMLRPEKELPIAWGHYSTEFGSRPFRGMALSVPAIDKSEVLIPRHVNETEKRFLELA